MNTANQFTPAQLENWHSYEKVRQSAKFNMFDQRAERAAGLTSDEYTFVMDNFEALEAAYNATQGQKAP
jgi:hypothetical protein